MKKKISLIFLSLFVALGLFIKSEKVEASWQGYLSTQWSKCEEIFSNLDKGTNLPKWSGSESQPTDTDGDGLLDVTTPEQFRWAVANLQSMKLMNDIDLNGVTWVPVNAGTTGFTIDGNGHTVYNLKITSNGPGSFAHVGVGLISYANNANFWMKNITFRYANVRGSGYNFAVAVGCLDRGHLEDVAVEDSIVVGSHFVAGLAVGWDTAVDMAFNGTVINDNPIKTINRCHTTRVYTYGGNCIGNFTAPLMGAHVSNSYAVDGVTVSTGGHSGGFISCPGYNYIENCFCNITMYGQSKTAVFSGVAHHSNKYVNCYASGVVEGESYVGGFVGDGEAPEAQSTHSYYENCYSTSMVGMQNQAANMGGFVGYEDGYLHMDSCYSAGEVGALTTDPVNPGSVGGFGGLLANNYSNCYYDMQTSAMRDRVVGNATSKAGITGKQTQDLLGKMPEGFNESVWSAQEGLYPQLKAFCDEAELEKNFSEKDRAIVKAYSAASVCTAMLYPSNNPDYEDDVNYDTVRSIQYLFPLTNNEMVKNSSFDISWVADDTKSTVAGLEDLSVITLNNKTYAVASLAPGIGWTTVKVKYYPDPSNKAEYVVGTRRLRLVPTTTLSVATSAGIDHVIYVAPENARPLTNDKYTQYDHRDGVFFSKGNATQLNNGQLISDPFPTDNESFENVDLKTVGGYVNVAVAKQKGETWEEIDLDESLKDLLLKKRDAKLSDLGTYRLTYNWFASGSGAGGAYLESIKYLTVKRAYSVTYMLNDGTNKVYSFDPGAYVEGDTVVKLPDDPSRKGFLFDGWTIKEEETRKARAAGTFDETTPINGDVVVYAGWLPDTFKVKYETEDKKEEEIKTDEKLNLPEEPKKDGYSFTGWTLEPDGEEPIDLDDKTLLDLLDKYPEIFDDPDHEITFYPVFEKNPKPDIKLEVENTTDPDAENVQVNDELKYTVTVSNKEEGSNWKDVTITNTLPEGLTLKGDTVTLRDPEGNEIVLEVKDIYNEETRTIEVPIDVIKGNEEYILEYEVVVNKKTLEDKKDISNTVEVSGKNADGSASSTESESVTPTGGEEILHADPKPEIQITVENKTRPGKENLEVGDELRYTVELTNGQENSKWLDVKVEDILPEGLTVLPESIVIEYPDGHQERVNIKDVYNEETRELSIPVGEIGGNETYKVILDVKVNEKANNLKDGETLGLNIKVNGKTPTGETTDSKGMIVISPEEFKIGAEVADTGDSRTKDMIYIIGALGVSGVCLLFLLLKRKKVS